MLDCLSKVLHFCILKLLKDAMRMSSEAECAICDSNSMLISDDLLHFFKYVIYHHRIMNYFRHCLWFIIINSLKEAFFILVLALF